MLFVVENNGIAQTTPTADTIGGSIVARGAAFGLPPGELDDSGRTSSRRSKRSSTRVRATAPAGISRHRHGALGPHSKGDDLRDPAEMRRHRRARSARPAWRDCRSGARAAIEAGNAAVHRDVASARCSARESQFDVTPRAHVSRRNVEAACPAGAGAYCGAVNVRASLNASLRRLLETHPDVIPARRGSSRPVRRRVQGHGGAVDRLSAAASSRRRSAKPGSSARASASRWPVSGRSSRSCSRISSRWRWTRSTTTPSSSRACSSTSRCRS